MAGVSHKPRHAVPVDDQRVCACWLYVAEAGLPIVCPSYGDLLKASVVRVGARRARGRSVRIKQLSEHACRSCGSCC